MANIQSKKKNIRKIAKRNAVNVHARSRLKTLAKTLDKAELAGDAKATQQAANDLVSAFDKAAKRGIVHKNKASRMKSRAAKHIFAA